MSTSVGYSMTDPCAQCGASGPDRWVEIRHTDNGDEIGECMQCRGLTGERTEARAAPKPVQGRLFE